MSPARRGHVPTTGAGQVPSGSTTTTRSTHTGGLATLETLPRTLPGQHTTPERTRSRPPEPRPGKRRRPGHRAVRARAPSRGWVVPANLDGRHQRQCCQRGRHPFAGFVDPLPAVVQRGVALAPHRRDRDLAPRRGCTGGARHMVGRHRGPFAIDPRQRLRRRRGAPGDRCAHGLAARPIVGRLVARQLRGRPRVQLRRLGVGRAGLVTARRLNDGRAIRSGDVAGQAMWRPHSDLSRPCHRPDRGSSPGATLLVHGMHPIDG